MNKFLLIVKNQVKNFPVLLLLFFVTYIWFVNNLLMNEV